MKSDQALSQDVERSLRGNPAIDARRIDVGVHHGVVTLTGTVPTALQKLAVEKAVQGIDGCKALVMELTTPFVTTRVKTDELLAARIVEALSSMPDLPPERVRVEIEHGCATLTGWVERESQRHAIEKLVDQIEGVVGISNRIAVREVNDRLGMV